MNTTFEDIVQAIQCREVNDVNVTEQCNFVLNQPDCHNDIGYVNYLSFMYCSFGPGTQLQAVGIAVLWLLVLFVGLGVTANDFLCPALFVISKNLRLSQNVAGVTLLAFGNGSPDIFSALAGIRQGKTDLVIGGLVGAGIFVTTVVAGSVFLTGSFKMMKRPFLRDVAFYMVAASWAFYLFFAGSIQLFHAVGFMALYLLYIVVVVVSRIIHQKHNPSPKDENEKAKEAEAKGEEIHDVEAGTTTFHGENPDDNPEAVGVVLKSFYFYNNGYQWDEETNTVPDNFEPPTEIFVLSEIARADQGSGNHRMSLSRTDSNKGEDSVMKVKPVPVKAHSEIKLLLEILSPVDLEAWGQKTWLNHGLELAKSPILFALTLTSSVVDYRAKMNNWCRSLCVLQCLTGPLFIVFATGNGTIMFGGVFPLAALVTILGLGVGAAVFFTSKPTEPPRYHAAFAYFGFAVAVTWIYIISIEIVVLLQAIGIVFNLSDTLIGLTILAWGNCLLDFMANVSVAKKGFPRMGVAACFGSPFLTLLMGVGVPCAIQLFGDLSLPGVALKFSPLVVILFTTLGISLISTVVSMVATKFVVKRPYGVYLIALYLVFLIIAILVEIGVLFK